MRRTCREMSTYEWNKQLITYKWIFKKEWDKMCFISMICASELRTSPGEYVEPWGLLLVSSVNVLHGGLKSPRNRYSNILFQHNGPQFFHRQHLSQWPFQPNCGGIMWPYFLCNQGYTNSPSGCSTTQQAKKTTIVIQEKVKLTLCKLFCSFRIRAQVKFSLA